MPRASSRAARRALAQDESKESALGASLPVTVASCAPAISRVFYSVDVVLGSVVVCACAHERYNGSHNVVGPAIDAVNRSQKTGSPGNRLQVPTAAGKSTLQSHQRHLRNISNFSCPSNLQPRRPCRSERRLVRPTRQQVSAASVLRAKSLQNCSASSPQRRAARRAQQLLPQGCVHCCAAARAMCAAR